MFKAMAFQCPVCGWASFGSDYDSEDEFLASCKEHLKGHVEWGDIGSYVSVKDDITFGGLVDIIRVYDGYFDGDKMAVVLKKVRE